MQRIWMLITRDVIKTIKRGDKLGPPRLHISTSGLVFAIPLPWGPYKAPMMRTHHRKNSQSTPLSKMKHYDSEEFQKKLLSTPYLISEAHKDRERAVEFKQEQKTDTLRRPASSDDQLAANRRWSVKRQTWLSTGVQWLLRAFKTCFAFPTRSLDDFYSNAVVHDCTYT